MTKMPRWLLHGLIALCSLFLAGLAGLATAQPLPDQSRDRTLGVASCASSLCHGSIDRWEGSPVQQNEYVIWSRLDKHARSYQLLLNATSRRIAANLGLPQPAHQSKICLDCHVHNPAGPAAPAHSVRDGIACEGCHGPADRWIAGHTAPGATHAANLANGLYPTEQPLARARLCLSCHFGARTKFVTHRIMAAGHPRMSFEMETFTNLQPAHFTVDADYLQRKGRGGGASEGLQVWAIGQALAVATQMEMLLDPQRGRDGLFPELTLFDCHACHHPMADTRWKPLTPFGKAVSPGLVRLNSGSMLMLRLVLLQVDPPRGEAFVQAVQQLDRAVAGERGGADVPAAAHALQSAADDAARAIARLRVTGDHLRGMALALVDDGLAGAYADYAGAEQAAMALGSVVNALHKLGALPSAARLNEGLARVRAGLAKDEAYDRADFQARLRTFRPLLQATR